MHLDATPEGGGLACGPGRGMAPAVPHDLTALLVVSFPDDTSQNDFRTKNGYIIWKKQQTWKSRNQKRDIHLKNENSKRGEIVILRLLGLV